MNAGRPVTLALGLLAAAGTSHAEPPGAADTLDALFRGAEPGAIVHVPPGVYHGHLIVDRPVTLDGGGAVTIDGDGEGTVVTLASADVTFRGFTVRGSGSTVGDEPAGIRVTAGPVVVEANRVEDTLFGIDLRESWGSVVRDNVVIGKDLSLGRRGDGIRLWWSHDCLVTGNEVSGVRDMVFWYSERLSITGNRVTDSRYGLHFMYSHDTTLADNTLIANSVGIYLMYSNHIVLHRNRLRSNRGASGYGIGLKDCDDITVDENVILANRVGVYVDNSPSSIGSAGLIRANLVAFNEIGVLATPNTHDNVVTGNGFVENEEQVAVHGRGSLEANRFSDGGTGNFWSDYAGFDGNGDGRGDLPYEPRSLFESLLAREPNLRFFLHSPAEQAIEFTARAFPEIRPEPNFVDAHPLVTPVEVRVAMADDRAGGLPMAAFAAGLVAIAAGASRWLGRERSLTPCGGDASTVSRRLRS